MRRFAFAVLMMLLLPLSACGGGETDPLQAPMDFRTTLLAAESCSFTAQIRADVGDMDFTVCLDCRCFPDGGAEMTVREPETLAGIEAALSQTGGTLEFDGVAVDFGLIEDRLAPLMLPPLLAEYWRTAYIASAGQEDGLLHVRYEDDRDPESPKLDCWFDGEGLPCYAEFSLGGAVCATLTLTNVTINGG